MGSIPNRRAVSQAIRTLRKTLKQTIKEVNQDAADLARKGAYERAESAMAKGREVLRFRDEVAAIEKRWKELSASRGSAKSTNGNAITVGRPIAPSRGTRALAGHDSPCS